ncbi:hypothetical protein KP509_1Z074000 [Ceratopteris richardii]|nr:hypothetical protein KP509_1Z074000 [Ceratopteris richardii]
MSAVPSSLSSRNSGVGAAAGGPIHQPSGGLSGGRFPTNTSLSQISHVGLHTRTGLNAGASGTYSGNMNGAATPVSGPSHGINNRGMVSNLGVSPSMIGSGGPRLTNSVGNMVSGGVGGSLSRNLNSGAGINVPGFSGSRASLGPNANGGLTAQGPGRPSNTGIQPASPQMIPLLGNNYPNSGVGQAQSQPTANGQLSSMGLMSDADGAPFDMNDFPQLSSRPSSSGSQRGIAALRKQVGVNPIVQQSQEFSIQNEDFPALPGFKGGNSDFPADVHQKDSQRESALPLIQSQHLGMGRSAGFTLGSSYMNRQQQQPSQLQGSAIIPTASSSSSFTGVNSGDLLQMHPAVEMFQAPSVGPPVVNSGQVSMPSLRTASNPSSGIGSYEQLVQQYQQQQSQSQFRLGPHQQLAAVGAPQREMGLRNLSVDRFGLLGLLGVIRMTNPDLTTLALGADLTLLGLDLNARDDVYKTFASPWADRPAKGEPEFTLPQCYVHEAPTLQPGLFAKFQPATLFYIFYSMPNDEAQVLAANELYNRNWFYHKELQTWFTRVPNVEPLVTTPTYERGSYFFFDVSTWDFGRKDHFVLHYDMVEKVPQLPEY